MSEPLTDKELSEMEGRLAFALLILETASDPPEEQGVRRAFVGGLLFDMTPSVVRLIAEVRALRAEIQRRDDDATEVGDLE